MDNSEILGLDPQFILGLDPQFILGLDPQFILGLDPQFLETPPPLPTPTAVAHLYLNFLIQPQCHIQVLQCSLCLSLNCILKIVAIFRDEPIFVSFRRTRVVWALRTRFVTSDERHSLACDWLQASAYYCANYVMSERVI